GGEEWKLDRVTDLLDLALEAADVLVADIGDLLEDELLHLFSREELRDHDRAGVEQHAVARPDGRVEQLTGQERDMGLIAAAEDQRSVVAEPVLHLDDLPGDIGVEDLDDIQRLIEHDLGGRRSEEHTSELQSRSDLVCRLLLEKKKTIKIHKL